MKKSRCRLVKCTTTGGAAQQRSLKRSSHAQNEDQEQKKAAEAKSKQKVIEIKEVKFRPGTDDGDYAIKMRNLRRFIAEDGDKGKVTLRFRGREITHQDIGMRLLERVRDDLQDVSLVEHMPKLEGRQMIMVLAPKRK